MVTLACHIAAALLFWRVLAALAVPGAWLGAALWALHPVQVESVAWICELKNTQSAVFFLAAVLCWVRWMETRECGRTPAGPRHAAALRYAAALLCAVLAILSKSSTVMLPVVLALCLWWRSGRIRWGDLPPLAPFLVMSALAAGWTIWEQAYRQQAYGDEWALSLPARLIVAGRAIWFYAGKLLWPANLAFIYPRWAIDPARLPAYLPALAAVAAGMALFAARSRGRGVLFAGGCFVALLFPVLGFFNVYFFRFSFVGDHFQYLASMAPLALVGASLTRVSRTVRIAGGAAVLVAFTLLTARQSADYRDPETLWRATLARSPQTWMAWDNLGELLVRKGRFAEGIACHRRALALNPGDADAHHNLGFAALMTRDLETARAEFERALDLNPRNARTHNGYGFVLASLGRTADALSHYEIALRILPEFTLARRNLAMALARSGRAAEAAQHYERLVATESDNAAVQGEFADVLGGLGRWSDAVSHYEAALRLAPATAGTYARLGVALGQSARPNEALAMLQHAAELDPNDSEIQRNLGLLLRDLGRTGEASDHLARAAALKAGEAR
jgi:tetratricopeptide (TPR) repeat protein